MPASQILSHGSALSSAVSIACCAREQNAKLPQLILLSHRSSHHNSMGLSKASQAASSQKPVCKKPRFLGISFEQCLCLPMRAFLKEIFSSNTEFIQHGLSSPTPNSEKVLNSIVLLETSQAFATEYHK